METIIDTMWSKPGADLVEFPVLKHVELVQAPPVLLRLFWLS